MATNSFDDGSMAAAMGYGGTGSLMSSSSAFAGAGALSALAGAYTTAQQGKIAKIGYWLQEQTTLRNMQMAEWQAEDAYKRGDSAVTQLHRKGSQFKGSQRASLASRGVDMTQGSALRILSDTDYMMAEDEATLRDNIENEARAYRLKAVGLQAEAGMANFQGSSVNPNLMATSSLLTSAPAVASTWYSMRRAEKG